MGLAREGVKACKNALGLTYLPESSKPIYKKTRVAPVFRFSSGALVPFLGNSA